jgi:hypothetical protein
MFHLEVSGPGEISGTLILPPGDQTYLVHCDMAGHMEKGLKAQLKVGKGSGDLPSIPGITAGLIADNYNEAMPPSVVPPAKTAATPANVANTEEPFFRLVRMAEMYPQRSVLDSDFQVYHKNGSQLNP